jgi:hypothetical protein
MTKNITEKQIDKQQALTKKRLYDLKPKYDWKENRPKENFIDLMQWVKTEFSNDLAGDNLQPYVHSKITINGSFIEFARKKKITIECLMRDSIASWKTDLDSEHFTIQGVFKITKGDFSFIHAALFHKGNQNEDEVSFFIIVNDSNFFDYSKIRDKYMEWLLARERDQLEIHVVGGDDIPYTRNNSWDDLYLPDDLKSQIQLSIEGFLNAKDLYERKNIPWRRGFLLYGEPGCGKTSCIKTIISNYDLKPVTVLNNSELNDNMLTEAFDYAQEQGPSLLYIEDLDSMLNSSITLSHFLNLMDGISSCEGVLVIATANDLSKLSEAVINRPSRFDRKWEFPLPDKEMSTEYLKKWFGDAKESKKIIKEIVKDTVNGSFSYAYLKELYITSAYFALADDREEPTIKDIKLAKEQIIKSKNDMDDINGSSGGSFFDDEEEEEYDDEDEE